MPQISEESSSSSQAAIMPMFAAGKEKQKVEEGNADVEEQVVVAQLI